MERAAFGLLFFVWTSCYFCSFWRNVNAGAGSIRGDARQRGCVKRRVIAYGSRISIGMLFGLSVARSFKVLKQRRRLKSPVKPYPIEDKLRAKRKAHEPGSN